MVLTGATGFIGSAVLTELLRRRHRVLVLLRPESDRGRLLPLASEDVVVGSKID
ncbi:MAG TPA: SDR family oxidoreductase, partial [Verrucomicrobiae bacterium]|nr:SDR family oxidoreductase [Verrucomicrobiae bacterium]